MSKTAVRLLPNLITAIGLCVAFYAVFDNNVWLAILAQPLDILDGWVARRLNAESKLGAYLDHVGDVCVAAAIAILLFGWYGVLSTPLFVVAMARTQKSRQKASGRSLMVVVWLLATFQESL